VHGVAQKAAAPLPSGGLARVHYVARAIAFRPAGSVVGTVHVGEIVGRGGLRSSLRCTESDILALSFGSHVSELQHFGRIVN
jgi:hypothetical protein